MQRKSGFPVANCSIKMPDSMSMSCIEPAACEEETEQRRQQLINFGHSQWGFNNWSWSVTKQEMDFVDPIGNGKFCAGVVAFVSVTVKSFDIQRENIGYATSIGLNKGLAIYKSRKCAVTNALRETLLSFGGSVATELMELLEAQKSDVPPVPNPVPNVPEPENNQNLPNKPVEPKNAPKIRKEENSTPANCVRPHPPPAIKNAPLATPPPVAKAHPMPVSLPRPAPPRPAAAPPRPNSNEDVSEEEARAERKRRQQQAKEEFRLKQLAKQAGNDDKDLSKASTSIDRLLLAIPTQDIVIEESGAVHEDGKRKSPGDGGAPKRRTSILNRLDIVAD